MPNLPTRDDKSILMALGTLCLAGMVWTLCVLLSRVLLSNDWIGLGHLTAVSDPTPLKGEPLAKTPLANTREPASLLATPQISVPCKSPEPPLSLKTKNRHVMLRIEECAPAVVEVKNLDTGFSATLFKQKKSQSTDLIPLKDGENSIELNYGSEFKRIKVLRVL